MVTEGSAGSTAISLATAAPAYGCQCHVVIPDDAAIEKVSFDYMRLINLCLNCSFYEFKLVIFSWYMIVELFL